MKKILSIFSTYISGLLLSQNVGVKTPSPTERLDINGTMAIGTSVYVDQNTYTANANGFDVIAVDPESTIVNGKVVKVETLFTPIIVQPYSITNIYRDDLNNLDLQIPSDKYMVAITNFEAVPTTVNGTEPNNGVHSTTDVKGHFVIRAFQSGGTWRVNIGYPTLNTQYTSGRYTYNFDVILLSKRFFKVLDEASTTYDLGGSNIGDALTAPAGI